MTFDPSSAADPAPTRRSSRALPTGSQATSDVRRDEPLRTPPYVDIDPSTSRRARRAAQSTGSTPAAASAPSVDEFEIAARLFSFTGENPVIAGPAADTSPVRVAAGQKTAAASHKASRRPKVAGHSFKRMTAASFSVGVMGIVGLLAVGMTTPAQAVASSSGSLDTTSAMLAQPAGDVPATSNEIQAYVAPSQTQNVGVDRSESYQTGTLVEMAGVAGISQTSSSVFTADPNCPIQWPFAVGVPMSYGFGMRSGTLHEGIDFTPGEGAHIQAIADGVVRISTDDGGAYGVTIVIDHVVDGQLVSSRYAHMIYGSRQVQVGDKVSVGEFIGQTGDTGRSFGAHTHFEIEPGGGTAIDPLPWLQAHATC
ncbi:M23 family metallopeptidase [Microbacterium sp. P03]|uniref:M23 family metallopeptidase n=1 Tax=Microbacterium sp. P03 TaxID=3366946 RepID=UPI003745605C